MEDNPSDELRRQLQTIIGPLQQVQSMTRQMQSMTEPLLQVQNISKQIQIMTEPLSQMQKITRQMLTESVLQMQSITRQTITEPLRQMQIAVNQIRNSGAFSYTEELTKMLNGNTALISQMTLFKSVLDTIDEETFEKIQDVFVEEIYIEKNDSLEEEEINIVHPSFYNAGVTINTYVLVTDNQIYTNENINAEEKSLWEKRIKPALIFLANLLIIWATSDSPIQNWNIFEPIQKVANIIENYEYPIETTDLEIVKPTDISDNEKNE